MDLNTQVERLFAAARRTSFEPGGQLELSPVPRRNVPALLDDVCWLLDGHEQWLVANLAGPALAAAFAHSRPGRRARRAHRDLARRRPAPDRLRRTAPRPGGPGAGLRRVAHAAPRLPLAEAADDAYHLTTLFRRSARAAATWSCASSTRSRPAGSGPPCGR